jgi:hypothetical protein
LTGGTADVELNTGDHLSLKSPGETQANDLGQGRPACLIITLVKTNQLDWLGFLEVNGVWASDVANWK